MGVEKHICKNLYILSSREDVKLYFQNIAKEDLVFAWEENAVFSLEQRDIKYLTLVDIEQNDVDETDIFRKVNVLSKFLNHLDKENSLEERALFNSKLHSLRIPFFIYTYEIDKFLRILSNIQFEKAVLPSVIGNIKTEQLLKYFKSKIDFELIKKEILSKSISPKWFQKNSFLKVVAKKISGRSKFKSWKSLFSGLLRQSFFFNKKPVAFIYSVDWRHDEVLKRLKKHYNFIFAEDLFASRDKQECHVHLESDTQHHYKDVPISKILKVELEEFVREELPVLMRSSLAFEKANEVFNFTFAFSSYYLTELEVVVRLLNKEQKKSYIILHGGTVGIIKGFPYTPMSTRPSGDQDCSRFLVYSDLIASDIAYAKKHLPDFKSDIKVVGENYFRSLRPLGLTSGMKRSFCYVYSGTGIYNAAGKWGQLDEASLYSMRHDFLRLVNSKKLNLTFKFGYGAEVSGAFEKDIMNKKVAKYYTSQSSLKEVADQFEFFILEVPSTTLIELIAMGKTVVCLIDKHSSMLCDGVRESLEKACYCAYSKDELAKIVIDLHNEGSRLNPKDMKEFIDFFCAGGAGPSFVKEVENLILKECL